MRVAALGHVLTISPTHVSPAAPVERWSVQREGSMFPLDSRREQAEARAAVEAGIVTAYATGRDLLEVLMDGADAARRQESLEEACQCVADLARGRCYGARPDRSATLHERELLADGLVAFLATCRAAGWTVTPDGRVVETWKDRARGTWIDHVEVEFWEAAERGRQWLRVEDGFVCEVWSDSGTDEDPESGSWMACVDRSPGDRLYKSGCKTPEEAQAWAVAKARTLAKVAATTKRGPKGRAA